MIDLFRFSHHWSMCPVHSFLHNIQFEFMWNAFYFNLINTLIVHWILNVIMHPVHSNALFTYVHYRLEVFVHLYTVQLCTLFTYVHFTILYILQLCTFTIMYILQLCTFIHLCTLYIYIHCKFMCTVHLCTLYTTL